MNNFHIPYSDFPKDFPLEIIEQNTFRFGLYADGKHICAFCCLQHGKPAPFANVSTPDTCFLCGLTITTVQESLKLDMRDYDNTETAQNIHAR